MSKNNRPEKWRRHAGGNGSYPLPSGVRALRYGPPAPADWAKSSVVSRRRSEVISHSHSSLGDRQAISSASIASIPNPHKQARLPAEIASGGLLDVRAHQEARPIPAQVPSAWQYFPHKLSQMKLAPPSLRASQSRCHRHLLSTRLQKREGYSLDSITKYHTAVPRCECDRPGLYSPGTAAGYAN